MLTWKELLVIQAIGEIIIKVVTVTRPLLMYVGGEHETEKI